MNQLDFSLNFLKQFVFRTIVGNGWESVLELIHFWISSGPRSTPDWKSSRDWLGRVWQRSRNWRGRKLREPGLVKKPFTYWTLFDPGVLFMETARDEKNGVGRFFSPNAREICRARVTFDSRNTRIHTLRKSIIVRRGNKQRKEREKRRRNSALLSVSKRTFFFSPARWRKTGWNSFENMAGKWRKVFEFYEPS